MSSKSKQRVVPLHIHKKLRRDTITLRVALEFYADIINYSEPVSGRTNVLVDGGHLARKALKGNP